MTDELTPGNGPATTSTEGAPDASAEEQAFFDINQIPEEDREKLAPSFKAMQGAWTKKTQELAKTKQSLGDLTTIVEQLGGPETVSGFLSRISTDDGVLGWWKDVAERIGPERAIEMLGINGTAPKATKDDPGPKGGKVESELPEGVLTKAEWNAYLAEQAEAQKVEATKREIDSAFETIKVPAKDREIVRLFAGETPAYLPLAERIRRGNENYQTYLQEKAEELAAAQKANGKSAEGEPTDSKKAPGILKGSTPLTTASKPKTIKEAHEVAALMIKQLRGSNN